MWCPGYVVVSQENGSSAKSASDTRTIPVESDECKSLQKENARFAKREEFEVRSQRLEKSVAWVERGSPFSMADGSFSSTIWAG
jgi:hypothetical protein